MGDDEVLKNPLQAQEDKSGKKTATFLGVPLQGWAIVAISSVAVLYAVGWGSLSLYQKYKAQSVKTDTLQQTVDAVSQTSNQKISEANKHKKLKDPFRTIQIDTSAGHFVTAEYYPSDGCIHVTRTHGGGGVYGISDQQDLWIPDPSRLQASRGDETSAGEPALSLAKRLSEYPLQSHSHARNPQLRLVSLDERERPALEANEANSTLRPVQAGCLNPHPWGFRTWWGPANGCIAPFYRQWNDGCTHYQLYNACNGLWDPGINWTFCAGQHHP